ncbi:MAG: DNA translocase FtsK [Christensenellales bacterium]
MDIIFLVAIAAVAIVLVLAAVLIIFSVKKRRRRLSLEESDSTAQNGAIDAAFAGDELQTPADAGQEIHALEERLRGLGLRVSVKSALAGNAFTRYELLPDIGERASKVLDFESDIALALGSQNLFIQIPLPGKSTVGIDAPVQDPSSLSLGGVLSRLEKEEKRRMPGEFTIATGAGGQLISSSIDRCAHVLIAGGLGTGKSMTLHSIASTMLSRSAKDDLRLIMIDIKGTELSAYKGLEHLLMPVISDVRTASGALGLAEIEMNERYKKLAAMELQDIEQYNKRAGEESAASMPRIVIFADDVNRMLGESGDSLARQRLFSLLEGGAKVGVHVVMTIPLPCSASLLDALCQSIPSRICLHAPSLQSAMAVAGSDYATKLAPQGDMLLRLRETGHLMHGRGIFVSQEGIGKLRAQMRDNPPAALKSLQP